MTDETATGTADTMRTRADDNGPLLWLLMRADRLLVAGGLTLVAFVGVVAAVDAIVPSLAARVESSDPVEAIFSTMIAVVVTGTTLVATIGQLVRIERIVDAHDDALTPDQRGLLDELTTALSLFGPAREHVKALCFQWELIELSRRIRYAAVSALVAASVTLVGIDADTAPGSTFGVDHLVVVGGPLAATLVPFMLFVSYILRILTVAKRTLAIGPLILRDS